MAEMIIRALILGFLLLSSSVTKAQEMLSSVLVAQSFMNLSDAGIVETCGVSMSGAYFEGDSVDGLGFNAILIASSKFVGFTKITGVKVHTPDNSDSDAAAVSVPVYGGWFRSPGHQAAIDVAGMKDDEDGKSKIFMTEFLPAFNILMAISEGGVTQISVSFREGKQSIFFGTPSFQSGHQQQLKLCLADLLKAISM